MINGHIVAVSTKTSDRALAEQIALKIEHEAVRSIMFNDEKPANLHAAIKAFLSARKGKGGHASATTHMNHYLTLPDVAMNQLKLFQVQEVISNRREAGAAHNTLAASVAYWNALQNFCKTQGWMHGPKLPTMKASRTRKRVLTREEEQKLIAALDPDANVPGNNSIKRAQRRDNLDLLICLLSLGCRLNGIAPAFPDATYAQCSAGCSS
jgi:integrase